MGFQQFVNRVRATLKRSAPEPLALIAQAADGLLFISESEYPLAPFTWSDAAPLSAPGLCRLAGLPADTPVAQVAAGDFFAPMLRLRADAPPETRARVARYQQLIGLLNQHLSEITVYKFGRVEMPVFIIGRLANGQFAGLRTTVVES